jgi:hypothetical protein
MTDFKKLQKEWYDKLKQSGFQDIEWSGGQDSRFLKSLPRTDLRSLQGTQNYYRAVENFLIHNRNVWGQDRFLLQCHKRGLTVEQTIKQFEAKYSEKVSHWTMFYRLQDLWKRCYKWNCTSKQGLFSDETE